MNINELFPSNYLKAQDLKGAARQVTIESVAVEEIAQGERKPVMKFAGVPVGLVLNKTNAALIAAHFGSETTAWVGKMIELYPDKVPFQGKIVDAIRARAVPPPAAAPSAPTTDLQAPAQEPTAPVAAVDDLSADVPW